MDHVHFRTLESEKPGTELSMALAGRASWTVGEALHPETTVLVSGRVEADWSALLKLRAVVIPWAGVPAAVAETVRSLDGVALYNLHHNAQAVAEHALALLLSCSRRIAPLDRALRKGDWCGRKPAGLLQLSGKTACVLGYGSIGRRLGPILHSMGMRVIGVRRSDHAEHEPGVEVVGSGRLGWALGESNALIVLAPSTPETAGVIGSGELLRLAPPRILVNVGRGDVVQETALVQALSDGTLHAAGIDVWFRYPKDDELLFPTESDVSRFENLVMTPHVGGHSDQAERLREMELAGLLEKLLSGEPTGAVDPDLRY